MNLEQYFLEKKKLVDQELDKYFQVPSKSPFSKLYEAMRYTLFPGGKRIRAILALASAEALKKDPLEVLPIACALEIIHNYSLIHDDLPALDDDDLRRGKPSNHIQFGEDIAILAGDALLTAAFEFLSHPTLQHFDAKKRIEAIHDLSRAAGPKGMAGGQACEIVERKKTSERDCAILEFLHIHKTGMLIRASLTTPALLLDAPTKALNSLKRYGEHLGLAFQIADDIQDYQKGKFSNFSYPATSSLDECRRRAIELKESSIKALASFGKEADPLRQIACFVVDNMHDKERGSWALKPEQSL
ncbi:MAG: polyprenyl synthetase family protein [Deltaproteobacteria bacterium]|nr:polyprenyl synthetase family protein [Deltaproteobacteria bacterium]